MSFLVLIRHGQSEWNAQNLFTGWRDPDLTAQGIEEAQSAGKALAAEQIAFDLVFTSALKRAQKTCALVQKELHSPITPIENIALNERDYGDLAGLNKDDARARWGEEQVHIWRRSFDTPPPNGESLKDTAARVLPYYQQTIRPQLKSGKHILIVAHGNSLRALVMALENIPAEKITELNISTGVPYIYDMSNDANMQSKKILS